MAIGQAPKTWRMTLRLSNGAGADLLLAISFYSQLQSQLLLQLLVQVRAGFGVSVAEEPCCLHNQTWSNLQFFLCGRDTSKSKGSSTSSLAGARLTSWLPCMLYSIYTFLLQILEPWIKRPDSENPSSSLVPFQLVWYPFSLSSGRQRKTCKKALLPGYIQMATFTFHTKCSQFILEAPCWFGRILAFDLDNLTFWNGLTIHPWRKLLMFASSVCLVSSFFSVTFSQQHSSH